MFLTRFFKKNGIQNRRKPVTTRQRRFSFLLVYSHGKTRTLSFSLTTLLSVATAICFMLVSFGFFVNSYMQATQENKDLHYLNDVAGIQEKQIQDLQQHLYDLSERLRKTEISENETRQRLMDEGLLEEGTFDSRTVISSRQVTASAVSRSSRPVRRGIALMDMISVLDSLSQVGNELEDRVCSLEDNLVDLQVKTDELIDYARAQPSIWPVRGNITSSYGWRTHPITHRQHFHEGVDIGAQYRTPIKAVADGQIQSVSYRAGYGLTITIRHGYGMETAYSHCNAAHVVQGQQVRRGDIIGEVGSSGVSTGPHLHYEIRKHGNLQDPMDYLPD